MNRRPQTFVRWRDVGPQIAKGIPMREALEACGRKTRLLMDCPKCRAHPFFFMASPYFSTTRFRRPDMLRIDCECGREVANVPKETALVYG